MDEWTNGRMNERMDERKSPCVLQDFIPFGAAAQKAYFRSERVNFRPERADFRPERADFRPERVNFRPERADFRPERAWGDKQTNG